MQHLEHRAAETAGEHVVLHRDQQRNAGGLAEQQGAVEGLDEAGIDDAAGESLLGGEFFRDPERVVHHRAERPDHEVRAGAEHLRLADGQGGGLGFHRHAAGGAARVTDKRRPVELQAGVQQVDQLILVLRLHDDGVGHAPGVGEVKESMVRGTVVGRETGAVEAEDDGQILQADVVNDGIVGALEEGRVNGADRPKALRGHAGGEEYGVLLRDADVEELPRTLGGEKGEAGAARHGRGDADDARVGLGEAGEGPAEDVLIVGRRAGRRLPAFAGDGVE